MRYLGRLIDILEWAIIVKIKINASVKVQNTIELILEENEMNTFKLSMINLEPLGTWNAKLEDIN